jgi:hypothetical protein
MNNPPAFPVQSIYIEDQETNSRGMTLRDYFAAKAMQGLLSSDVNAKLEDFAKQSYKVADAMLKAREA